MSVVLTEAGQALADRAADVPAALVGHLVDDEAQYRSLHAELSALAERLASTRAR